MTECLKDCIERVVPYWEKEIAPELKAGKVRTIFWADYTLGFS